MIRNILLFSIILTLSLSVMAQKAVKAGYQIGDKIEDFSLVNIDDAKVSLSSYENAKGYVIVFTCNHCPYAVMYEDRLIELHNNYAAKGYPVVAINPNDPEAKPGDSFENMKVRAAEKKFPFAYLFDDGQKIYPKFGATKTPHVFLVDADMVLQYVGAIDDSPRDESQVEDRFLENAINALIEGVDINPNSTKAIGCSIKTKS